MKQQSIFDYINVDGFSSTPKYLQLANSIQEAVYAGKIHKDRILPSLHELTYHLEISKDTADRGYKYLRKLGILSSIPGKGHYITATDVVRPYKIFLLINQLSTNKKLFYDTFTQALGENVTIDFYVYNNDFGLFKELLTTRRDGYTHYVILPHFTEGGEAANRLINTIPKDKLILIDKNIKGVESGYGGVFENFRKDIYNALELALPKLSKYDTIKLVYGQGSYFPAEIADGFHLFCQQYAFERSIIKSTNNEEITKGQVFICLEENDLIRLIERVSKLNLKVGKDVGIISYNETPLKKYILDGITTISTDFEQMGQKAAEMILGDNMSHIELDCRLKLRSSL
ncbi:substrate-binding domain-containing protein [Mucilaginibacter sp. HMF5004]|uniref:substrate-binding domain-containing protein n=1 Tax=Mucilaginibacter rivuli TaxID=2857527 RepID=UPI001C6072EF|nr:substrate-binding domain-containing protein [Mucilaginibacter rivuli]MBW4889012.1 substrate-binding domain-containing protein [Mucilaginibacter rivuli]